MIPLPLSTMLHQQVTVRPGYRVRTMGFPDFRQSTARRRIQPTIPTTFIPTASPNARRELKT